MSELKQNKSNVSEDEDEKNMEVVIFEPIADFTQSEGMVEIPLLSVTIDELEQKISTIETVQQHQINILSTDTKRLEKAISTDKQEMAKDISNLRESLDNFKNGVQKNVSQLEDNFIRKHTKLKEEQLIEIERVALAVKHEVTDLKQEILEYKQSKDIWF